MKGQYKVRSKIFLYPGAAGWHFLPVPKKQSADIKKRFGANSRGWSSLRVAATVGKTTWTSSIFPDKRSGTYLLPLKAEVRKKEAIAHGDTVTLTIVIN